VVAVAVVIRGREVLVGRRSSRAVDGPGLDEFPGGKVEPGETPAEAAVRECLEESGLRVQPGPLLDRAHGWSSNGPIEVCFFACRAEADDTPQPPFGWVPLESLARLRFPETNRRVLGMLAAGDLPAA
jgi:mutator protein MutT